MIKAFWNDELVAFVSFKKRSGSLCVVAKFQTDVTIGGELVDDCWPLTSSSTIAPRSVLDALLLLLPPSISSAAATETDTLLVTTVGVTVDPAIDFRIASLPFSGPLLILLSSTSDDDDDSTTIDDDAAELWNDDDDDDDDTDGPTTTELTRLRLAPRPLLTFTYW